MREGWKYKKLKDVASLITDGDWIESRHQSESGIRLIQTGNVGNGIFKAKDDKPHYISEDTFLELGCTEIFRGDCLVSRLPEPVGRACIIPEVGCRMITAVDCTIIRFKDCVLPKLFVYYTRSKQYKREIDNSTTGTTRKRISRKNLESVSIPLLPVDEQNKIVAELDLLTEIIDKQKQQLKELDTLAQSVYHSMFNDKIAASEGWRQCKVGDVYKFQYGKGNRIPESKGNYPCYGSNGMVGYHIHYNSEDAPIIGHIGAYAGIVNWGAGKHFVTYNGVMCWLKSKQTNPIYGYYMLKSQNYLEMARNGMAQPFVSYDKLEAPTIYLPPLSLQESFAKKIQSIESQKQSINRSIAESQKLFDYTMDKYFG